MSQFELNAVFSRKEPSFEPTGCVVEKVIQLTGAEYDHFRRNMLADHDFIRNNVDLMYHEGNTLHCILAVHLEQKKSSVLGKIQEARLAPTPPKEPCTHKKEVRGEER